LKCPKGHDLQTVHGRPPCYKNVKGVISCDKCAKSYLDKEPEFSHCGLCMYDICSKCRSKLFTQPKIESSESDQDSDSEVSLEIDDIEQQFSRPKPFKVKTEKVASSSVNKKGSGSFDRKQAKLLRDKKLSNFKKQEIEIFDDKF